MTLKSTAMAAAPIVVGGVALGLLFYYLGDKPILKEAQQGLNGSTANGGFFSNLF